jgi:WS/DGAT/MGAT family acyltransferase
MDRMSPQDAVFLHVENEVSHMHIASVGIFEGPPPVYDEIVEMVNSKLHHVPRYRQRVRFVPLELGRPLWVDDPHFNIRYHIRHTSLPSPGSDEQLRNLVGRVMSQQLDRAKPLWEIWVAEGLEEDRWAILSKTHHCMVDGVSGTDLLTVILDQSAKPKREKPKRWAPEEQPSSGQLFREALQERLLSPYEIARSVRSALRGPRRLMEQVREIGSGLVTFRSLAQSTSETALNGPISPHRHWDWATTTLDETRAIRKVHGGTVNDVVLAVITRGFRDLLQSRGEPVADRVVRTLVPVSVRREDERGTYNNRVSVMFAELPVGIEDPLERLASIRGQMERLKEGKQAVAAEALTSMSGFAPPELLALAARVGTRIPQRTVQTVTTNVPGPQKPLYAAGRKMLRAMPYVPLSGWVRIGVAIFSYAGQLNFGVTADSETAPDIEILCAGVEEGVQELLQKT